MVDPALREDAVRQRPAARFARRRVERDAGADLPALRGGNRRLAHARDAIAGRWLLLLAGCRQRARGGQVLRLAARRDPFAAYSGGVRSGCGTLRDRGPAELRERAVASPDHAAAPAGNRGGHRSRAGKTFCRPPKTHTTWAGRENPGV